MPLTRPYSKHTPSTVTLDDGTVRDVPERMMLKEFAAFPWPAESRWELIWEVPVLAPAPLPQHQRLLAVLTAFIEPKLADKPDLMLLPGIDVSLKTARSWLVPDLAVVDARYVEFDSRPLRQPPQLIVELLSPSTSALDVGPKLDAYAEAGVPEYWIVDPQNGAVAMHVEPTDGEYRNPPADKDGYVTSPLLGVTFRVSRDGNKFKVLSR